jgi:hypothetical protein
MNVRLFESDKKFSLKKQNFFMDFFYYECVLSINSFFSFQEFHKTLSKIIFFLVCLNV